ncbi:alpha/beta hydrolase [Aspergillus mulundensis]|uniref:Alphabeta hydrolase fold n=1 Tax=Aspergillus mulundensis TaxID=1810919 RepID=A0A3D8REB3_9EURO|nr:Alphabeta hydrolase fold [Aspergillus mulundensis]RDW72395.1 Alphabeta hydrolase fold [Aspergillus mulundensis]
MKPTKSQFPPDGKTLVYSTVAGHPIHMDYYLPPRTATTTDSLPALIYYHGGGMTTGSRREAPWPTWMYTHCQEKGYIFISADYRLCHPANVLDQIADAKALFAFLDSPAFADHLPPTVSLDTARIAVTGFSAGAYSARAACLYARPKPAALLSVYGLGGDVLADHWTRARPLTSIAKRFDLSGVPAILDDKTVVSESSFEEGRFALTVHWEVSGTFLDGIFQAPGLGAKLDALPYEKRFDAIPDHLKPGVLQAFVTRDYPPSVFVHGAADEVVSPQESRYQHEQLRNLGVESRLLVIKGGPHGLEFFERSEDSRVVRDSMKVYGEALAFIDGIFKRT